MILYVHKGKYLKGEGGEVLVRRAWSLYTGGRDFPEIKRTDKGKPYFENSNVHFSISHSEEFWVCLFADFNVGVDIQIMKDCKIESIAERFFSQEEAEQVRIGGKETFYRIWTSREACGKYAGTGFILPSKFQHYPVFQEIFVSSGYKCMTAALKEEDVWITDIN